MSSKLLNQKLIELLNNLTFVGAIPDGKILNWTRLAYDDPDYFYDKLRRTLSFREGRGVTTNKIEKLTQELSETLEEYSKSSFYSVLLEHMLFFKEGILKLQYTYNYDTETHYKIDKILTKLDLLTRIHSAEISLLENRNNRFLQCVIWENRLKDKEETLKKMELYFRILSEELKKMENKLELRRIQTLEIFENLSKRLPDLKLESKDLTISVTESVKEIEKKMDYEVITVKECQGEVDVNGVLKMSLLPCVDLTQSQ